MLDRFLKKVKDGELGKVYLTDSVLLEFILVLRAKGYKFDELEILLNSLKAIMKQYSIKEISTINLNTLSQTIQFLRKGVTFFDALIAASAKILNQPIISDDPIYEKLGIKTIKLTNFLDEDH